VEKACRRAHALAQVGEIGVRRTLARQQQHLLEPQPFQRGQLAVDLAGLQPVAHLTAVGGKPAVGTAAGAVIREIKRCVELNRAAELAARQRLRPLRQDFQPVRRLRARQRDKRDLVGLFGGQGGGDRPRVRRRQRQPRPRIQLGGNPARRC